MKNFLHYAGQGFAFFLIFVGIGGCCYLVDKGNAERLHAEHPAPACKCQSK